LGGFLLKENVMDVKFINPLKPPIIKQPSFTPEMSSNLVMAITPNDSPVKKKRNSVVE